MAALPVSRCLHSTCPSCPHLSLTGRNVWGLTLAPQISRDCFSHRHSAIRTLFSAFSILRLNKWPKPANTQAVAASAVAVFSHPWGLVSAAPGRALLGLRAPRLWHGCLAKLWPRTGQDMLLLCPWWQHAGEQGRNPRHGTESASLPFSAWKIEMSLSKPSSRSTVPPTRKVLKSTFQQHVCPFAPGTSAARLQPSGRRSVQELVAAAAGSWGTTRKCASACSCSAWAACCK